jgi:DNA-binding NtrC family response regulator
VAVSGHDAAGSRTLRAEEVDDWFERAAGGTLFIDRIGDLSASSQGRLLSLLTEQSRDRGETTPPHRARHVRIIAGSNRSLGPDLAVRAFSDALFYRLNVIHINQMHQNEPGEEAMRARDITSEPCTSTGGDSGRMIARLEPENGRSE